MTERRYPHYALTNIAVQNAKPKEKPYKLTDGEGMFLSIQPNGSKYWRLKYRFLKKEKLLSLGTYPEVGLAKAREKRIKARELLADGIDPSEAKKDIKRALLINAENNFEAVAREWLEARKPG